MMLNAGGKVAAFGALSPNSTPPRADGVASRLRNTLDGITTGVRAGKAPDLTPSKFS